MLDCDLCHDTGDLRLFAACHPTAPLRVELIGDGTIVLSCYVPECNREVVRFNAEEYVYGEYKCPQCGFRLSQKTLNPDSMAVGAETGGPPPLCWKDNVPMVKVTWKDAARDVGKIAESYLKRIRELEAAWPSDFAMPVGSDDMTVEN